MSAKLFRIGQKVKFKAAYKRLFSATCASVTPPIRVQGCRNSNGTAHVATVTIADATGKKADFYAHWLLSADNAPTPKRRYGPRKKKVSD